MIGMQCMVCNDRTIFTYRIRDVEAAFCPRHIPNARLVIAVIA